MWFSELHTLKALKRMAGSRKNTTGSTSRNFLRKSCEETSFNQRHIGNHGFQRDPSSIAESKSSKGKSTKVGAQNKQQERRHQDLLYQQSQVLEGIDNVYPPIVITESNDNEEITLAGIPTTSNASMPKEQQKLYNKKALHVKRAMAVELAITTRSKFERSEATGTSIVDASEEKGYGNAEVIKDNLYLLGKAEESGFNSSTGMKKYNKLTNKQFSYLSTTDFRSNHLHSKLQLLKGSNKYKLQVSERSERALRKTIVRATTRTNIIPLNSNSFRIRLAPSSPLGAVRGRWQRVRRQRFLDRVRRSCWRVEFVRL